MDIAEIVQRFPSQDACLDYIERVRWEGKPFCPYCGALHTSPMKNVRRHRCNACNTSFSVTVRTVFHKTRLPLQKWFLALDLILNAKKGISARQLSHDLRINKDTAWRISIKIHEAMAQREQRAFLARLVGMHET